MTPTNSNRMSEANSKTACHTSIPRTSIWLRSIRFLGICWIAGWSGVNIVYPDTVFAFHDDEEAGEVTLFEGSIPVFSYVYRSRLEDGVDEQFRREAYLHPVYDPAGRSITMEFPDDHFHHRGVWFSWPWMQVHGREVELWHPSPLRHRFSHWIHQETHTDRASLSVAVDWVLDGEVVVGREYWNITAFPAKDRARLIDLVITLDASDQAISVRGHHRRGYGGLTLRTSPDLLNGRLDSDKGSLAGDTLNERFHWAALSNPERLIAVFSHPQNPKSPQSWLIRNQWGGLLNPQWPGTQIQTLEPGEPKVLRYGLFIHLDQPEPAVVESAYKAWLETGRKD